MNRAGEMEGFGLWSWKSDQLRESTEGITLRGSNRWLPIQGELQEELVPTLHKYLDSDKNLFLVSQYPDGEWVTQTLEILESEFPDKGFLALASSGSTGRPKVIVHDITSLRIAARSAIDHLRLEPTRFLSFFHPLYTAGVLNNLVLAQELDVPLVLMGTWDLNSPKKLFDYLSGTDFESSFWLSPRMAQIITGSLRINQNFQDTFRSKVRKVISATGPLSRETQKEFFFLTGTRLLNTYGTSEHLFISAERIDTEASDTFLLPHVDASLTSECVIDGSRAGHLNVTTPYQARGLVNETGGQMEFLSIQKNTPFPTGDIASLEGSLLSVRGRSDSLIVSSGLNISLELLERTVLAHADVSEVFATVAGTRIWLFLESQVDANTLTDEVRTLVATQLPKEYRPASISVLVQFPRTFSGKLDRMALRSKLL